jgi:hypothetical protein
LMFVLGPIQAGVMGDFFPSLHRMTSLVSGPSTQRGFVLASI